MANSASQTTSSRTGSPNGGSETTRVIRFVDLFCGIGGFHLGVTTAASALQMSAECVWACDIDRWAKDTYRSNFGIEAQGDIKQIDARDIPDHDLLCAGFPCQAFSVFGKMQGFADTRGALFFDIARVLEAKCPPLFILENVKQLITHHKGETISVILETLRSLGYTVEFRALDARDFGLPQKRERVIFIGVRNDLAPSGNLADFQWPNSPIPMKSLAEILESDVAEKYHASERIRESRTASVKSAAGDKRAPRIYHENKSGHVSAYPFACALRSGSSHNYLLVDGERRLTERELLRLQGFPDSFKVTSSYTQTRRQTGNAVPAPMIEAVAVELLRQYVK
jgi:DNA (cytosine-5)-methyltransferase 1